MGRTREAPAPLRGHIGAAAGAAVAAPDRATGRPGHPPAAAPLASGPRRKRRSARREWFASHPQWPIVAILAGYPLWWALGLADFMWWILAIPMGMRLIWWQTRGGRPVKVPPGFGLWLLFLVWSLGGLATLNLTPPETVASPVSHRVLAVLLRTAGYVGVTVLLLYAGNLTEKELPRRYLAWLLGLVGIYAVVGGLAGTFAPHFQFSSPTMLVMPHSIRSNVQVQALMHPGFAQVQKVLGQAEGRPKAPFDYTNTWGNCLAILLPWLIAAWWKGGTRRQRRIAVAAVGVSVIPIVYSLNRGLWLALAVGILYLAIRQAIRGRFAFLGGIIAALMLAAVIIMVSPLQQVITTRMNHQKSNNLRGSLSSLAIQDALTSPLIGYGDTRREVGSPNSIAVGPSAKCGNCGQAEVGSNGQLWLLLITDGVGGTALYLAFFVWLAWRYRRDPTPYGMAGILVILMSFVFMTAYDAVGAPLGFTMLSVAMLWRNEQERRSGAAPAPRPAAAAGTGRRSPRRLGHASP